MFRFSLAFCAALISATGQSAFGGKASEPVSAVTSSPDDSTNDVSLPATSRESETAIRGIPIDSGRVILNGQALESPYVVSRINGDVWINDELIAEAKDIADRKPRYDCELVAQLECELLKQKWVMAFDGSVVGFADPEAGMMLLGTLARAASQSEQIKLAMQCTMLGTADVTTAEWRTALRNFRADESILKLFDLFENDMNSAQEWGKETSDSYLQAHDSTRSMYGLSVVGMLLIALSAGTLLGHPPKNSISWSRIVRSPRAVTAVQRCLILIAAYSLFDLAATILATQTGYVEELNPLGVGLVLTPLALAAFKVSSTCLGAGLLWRLKNYHGAHVASWWLCMVLTLVTVRWVTVQSLFFV